MLSAENKEKLLKQLEFYFSDSNLPRDKFLRGKTQENPEGWVDLQIICSFTRVAHLFGHDIPPKGSSAPEAEVAQVAALLKERSQKLIVNEDGKQVKRAAAVVSLDEAAREADERSLYVAPLPYNATLDVLTSFFSQEAPVNAVRLRRHVVSKDFRGSVFVEFVTKEDACKVASRSLMFEGAPLRLLPKLDFLQQKIDDRHAKAAANGHSALAAAAAAASPQPSAQASPAVAQRPAALSGAPTEPAAVMKTEAAASGASAPEGSKRPADALLEEPSAKRLRQQADMAHAAAPEASVSCGKPAWADEAQTVARFIFQQPDKVPQAASLQMLRDSFGGPKAGVRNVEYVAGQPEGLVRFSSKSELNLSISNLAKENGHALLAGCPAKIVINKSTT